MRFTRNGRRSDTSPSATGPTSASARTSPAPSCAPSFPASFRRFPHLRLAVDAADLAIDTTRIGGGSTSCRSPGSTDPRARTLHEPAPVPAHPPPLGVEITGVDISRRSTTTRSAFCASSSTSPDSCCSVTPTSTGSVRCTSPSSSMAPEPPTEEEARGRDRRPAGPLLHLQQGGPRRGAGGSPDVPLRQHVVRGALRGALAPRDRGRAPGDPHQVRELGQRPGAPSPPSSRHASRGGAPSTSPAPTTCHERRREDSTGRAGPGPARPGALLRASGRVDLPLYRPTAPLRHRGHHPRHPRAGNPTKAKTSSKRSSPSSTRPEVARVPSGSGDLVILDNLPSNTAGRT